MRQMMITKEGGRLECRCKGTGGEEDRREGQRHREIRSEGAWGQTDEV